MQILRSVSQRMFRARPSVGEIEFWSVAFCPLLSIRHSYAGAIEARGGCESDGSCVRMACGEGQFVVCVLL